MKVFNLKLAQSEGQATIQGAPVANLIQVVQMMFGRGAPVQYDDIGFNQIDYTNPVLRTIADLPVSNMTPLLVSQAVVAINSLAKYQKRQVPNWRELYSGIQELINKKRGQQVPTGTPDNKVLFRGKNKWGKPLFYIFNLGRKVKTIQEQVGDWKNFSKDATSGIDVYQIDPKSIFLVAGILKHYGYDISDMSNLLIDRMETEMSSPKKAEEKP